MKYDAWDNVRQKVPMEAPCGVVGVGPLVKQRSLCVAGTEKMQASIP